MEWATTCARSTCRTAQTRNIACTKRSIESGPSTRADRPEPARFLQRENSQFPVLPGLVERSADESLGARKGAQCASRHDRDTQSNLDHATGGFVAADSDHGRIGDPEFLRLLLHEAVSGSTGLYAHDRILHDFRKAKGSLLGQRVVQGQDDDERVIGEVPGLDGRKRRAGRHANGDVGTVIQACADALP